MFKIRNLLIILLMPTIAHASVNKFDLLKGNRLDVDNVRIDGNTVSTTNSNGDLTFDANGTGSLILTDLSADTALYLDASKKVKSSSVTTTQLGYVATATSNICGISQSCTLTNKTLSGSSNTFTDIPLLTAVTGVLPGANGGTGMDTTLSSGLLKFTIGTPSVVQVSNADVAAAAGIGVTKLEALTASRPVITDGSGFLTTEAALDVSRGGTGQTTVSAAINALLPSQSGNSGKYLTTNGTDVSWATGGGGGSKSAGEVFTTAATSCPSGSIAADGSSLLRSGGTSCGGSDCVNLYNAIGTTYGTVDGTHFTLPDLRGVFVRGAGSQTISAITYTGTQGTSEQDNFQGHRHMMRVPAGAGGASLWGFTFWSANRSTTLSDSASAGEDSIGVPLAGSNGTPRYGSETRPANVVLKYCIVY